MVITKQKLAQKRNYFKFVLTGMTKPIDFNVLTEWEQEEYSTILNIKDDLIEKFDNNSRKMGLTVPDKCWCGKSAKYKPIGYPDYINKVCKKHINYGK